MSENLVLGIPAQSSRLYSLNIHITTVSNQKDPVHAWDFQPNDEYNSCFFVSLQVNLTKVGDDGDDSNYIKNSEWTLLKLHAQRNVVFYSCCAEPYPDVTYTIQIRRKPLFYVFNMILPCMLITLVALLGFYIPSDSGEKVTMGITTLLSMTVFLMLVAESMPPTSDVLPLIGKPNQHSQHTKIKSRSTAPARLSVHAHLLETHRQTP